MRQYEDIYGHYSVLNYDCKFGSVLFWCPKENGGYISSTFSTIKDRTDI